MNFRPAGINTSVLLMSVRPGAPYADRVEEEGRVLIYEGHDVARTRDAPDAKAFDQPLVSPSGAPTQNVLFLEAAERAKRGVAPPERVRVYQKVRQGIWVFAGIFALLDAWMEQSGRRSVFKFKLVLDEAGSDVPLPSVGDLAHTRVIPPHVRLEVWRRDKGRCVKCGSTENLHFDHIIAYSRGGTSLVAENIQLLCARHNLEKRDSLV
ncbi:MAG: HNH endonuclease [Gemmatimonadetes bacterium]|nr:HNH endonuclease [Gemmatimonadota bacterium]